MVSNEVRKQPKVVGSALDHAIAAFDRTCRDLTPLHPLFPERVREEGRKMLFALRNSISDKEYRKVALVIKYWENSCVKCRFAHTALGDVFRMFQTLQETGVLTK